MITIQFTDSEMTAVLGLMHAGVKLRGLRALQVEAVAAVRKIEAAVSEHQAQATAKTTDG